MFAFLVLKTGPSFLFFFENLVLPAERRGLFKKEENDPILALKTGPIMLRNMLGPSFDASFNQFLTLGFLFSVCVSSLCLGWNPYFIVFSENAKLKETQKRKKTLFVSTPVLTALVPMSFFSTFFIFVFFFAISKFLRDVLDR